MACANGQHDPAEPETPHGDGAKNNKGELRRDSVPSRVGDVSPGDDMGDGKQVELGPGLQRLVDLAKKDLGTRLDVDPAEIEIIKAEYVVWRDSALGCPRPGTQAMQVLTNGARAKLLVGKRDYWYHSGQNRPPFLCETPSPVEPLPYEPGEA